MHVTSMARSLRAAFERVAVFIMLAVLWEGAVEHIFAVKPYLLPAFSKVLQSVWQNCQMLLDQALVNGGEIVLGYAAAVAGGVLIALGDLRLAGRLSHVVSGARSLSGRAPNRSGVPFGEVLTPHPLYAPELRV